MLHNDNLDAIRKHTKEQQDGLTPKDDFPYKAYRMTVDESRKTPSTIKTSDSGMDKCADLLLEFI